MKFDLGHINELNCVAVNLTADKVLYNYVKMKKKKGEISFVKINKRLTSIQALVKEIGNRHPLLIHFTGKGILNRKIKQEENYRHAILLNANVEDFYFTDYIEDNFVYSSVIRKNVVDDLLQEFSNHKLLVIGISSGPFITVPFAPFFDKPKYVVDDISITLEKDKLIAFEKIDEPTGSVNIGSDRIDFDLLATVAAGANYFNPSSQVLLSNSLPEFETKKEEAKQKNIFFRFAMGMMIFFLLLLTTNYFYLDFLNGKIESNYVELAEYEEQLADLSTLEEEKDRKENLLRSSGLLNKRFLSFYLMELADNVPTAISFEKIVVRPLVNEIKKKQRIEFYEHMITINGRAKTSDILSRWIDQLKKEEWLTKVDILDYTYSKNVGNFELEIQVN